MSLISIIIPVYNVERYIERCTRSVLSQTLEDIEIIFVDDCTPDRSMVIVEQVLAEYPQRRHQVTILHHKKNKGLSAARKTGLLHASGEYIGWVDSDDWVEPTMFQKMYEKAIRENADIVCCEIIREKKEGTEIEGYSYDEENQDIVVAHLEYGVYSAVWNKLVRHALYEQYNIWPVEEVSMWEDCCVTARLRYHSQRTVVLHDPLYHYNNMNEGSITVQNQLRRLNSQLMCVQFLADYFKPIMPEQHYRKLMEFCFKTKEPLFYPPYYDLKRWRTTVIDSNRYVMTYPNVPLFRRVWYYMFLNMPFGVADFVLRKHYHM